MPQTWSEAAVFGHCAARINGNEKLMKASTPMTYLLARVMEVRLGPFSGEKGLSPDQTVAMGKGERIRRGRSPLPTLLSSSPFRSYHHPHQLEFLFTVAMIEYISDVLSALECEGLTGHLPIDDATYPQEETQGFHPLTAALEIHQSVYETQEAVQLEAPERDVVRPSSQDTSPPHEPKGLDNADPELEHTESLNDSEKTVLEHLFQMSWSSTETGTEELEEMSNVFDFDKYYCSKNQPSVAVCNTGYCANSGPEEEDGTKRSEKGQPHS